MRGAMMAAAVAAMAVLLAPGGASATPATAAPDHGRVGLAEPVQHHPGRHGYGGFEGRGHDRHHRRHMRRAYEDARVADAARREARRIGVERAERRAWRHARRERLCRHNGF